MTVYRGESHWLRGEEHEVVSIDDFLAGQTESVVEPTLLEIENAIARLKQLLRSEGFLDLTEIALKVDGVRSLSRMTLAEAHLFLEKEVIDSIKSEGFFKKTSKVALPVISGAMAVFFNISPLSEIYRHQLEYTLKNYMEESRLWFDTPQYSLFVFVLCVMLSGCMHILDKKKSNELHGIHDFEEIYQLLKKIQEAYRMANQNSKRDEVPLNRRKVMFYIDLVEQLLRNGKLNPVERTEVGRACKVYDISLETETLVRRVLSERRVAVLDQEAKENSNSVSISDTDRDNAIDDAVALAEAEAEALAAKAALGGANKVL